LPQESACDGRLIYYHRNFKIKTILRKNILLIISFLYFAGSLWSLDPKKKITQYTLNTWKIERGLPNNTILAIAQDRSGYLWLGTAEGLVRFDGVNFTVFNSNNTTEFSDNIVNNLYVDRLGVLWIGTLQGKLLSLEKGRFKRHLFAENVSGINYFCIVEDVQGMLWVGTNEGLFYRSSADKEFFKKYRAFPGMKIRCLSTDLMGRLLLSSINKGLYRLEKEKLIKILSDTDKLSDDIFVIRQGRNGCLWLGTQSGLYYYQKNQLLDLPLKPGIAATIISLFEDIDGNLWVGSEGGLYRCNQGVFQSLDVGNGLGSNYVYSLYEDAEGSLWVGTIEGGLAQIRDEKITILTSREGLNGEVFRSLHGDDAGALWIGGYGGYLNRYQNGRIENLRLPVHFQSETIWSLAPDDADSFWLGTSSGLLHFQDGRFKEIPLPGPAANIEIRCVFKDRTGRLWIGTWGTGLLCWHNGKFTAYSTADGLVGDRISSIFENRQGDLWVGSENGLAVMLTGKPGEFVSEPFLKHCHVVSFYDDQHGTIWVGTRNQGLKVYRNGRWGSLNSDRGLFDNRIYAILEDDQGNLWLGGERGIFQARKSELVLAAFDLAQKVRGRLFDETDGMKSRICNNGNPAAWKDGNGRLWFANLVGVVSIDPAHIQKNDRVPPVKLEEALVDQKNWLSKDFDRSQEVKLPAGSQRFEFHYTALSFIRSDKIEFKYKLEGYDHDWTSAGNRRQAFYNNLKPGHYRFRVIAANADGVWNMAGAAFAFFLRPFVFQTWWFLVLAALAFAALSVLLWQLLKRYLHAVSFWKKKTYIGHFKILETIGTGGMATVYKAQDILDRKRIVALKVLKEENFHDENQKKRFKHESLITEGLDHPHIVHIIERGETDDSWYIAMELLQGESLALLIKRSGRLPVSEALAIMLQIVDALQAIHAQNIVHRDLKPENIMVNERPGRGHFVKLLDFGLAITPAQSRLTMSGVVMGTIRYLPPERISDGTSSPAGDIYSAGIILYEMLTGSKPFWSEATGEVIHRILKTYPLPPIEISREVPGELNALIMAMIDKDPAQRPVLAAIRAELQRLAETFPPQP
jgi:ligand-binding sensor domain-containing protein/tRNA A-37 threonylcarbamoyl transferase component Bud32